jgi:hypothetical protein
VAFECCGFMFYACYAKHSVSSVKVTKLYGSHSTQDIYTAGMTSFVFLPHALRWQVTDMIQQNDSRH